ncbi:bacteriocin [Hoylesella timonensis]|uniref:bacteriocin n=1 Tax=Hoylesella timonensis TaxID=386414 RepID=UPI00189838BC|nr:bacteriocin [Hoylesella timonensis]
MEKQHMRPLTEQELQTIYGGNIFKSIWNWIKTHIFVRTTDDPNRRIETGIDTTF